MYGRIDRAGTREGKKSLRKNKTSLVEIQKFTRKQEVKGVTSPPPPPLLPFAEELVFEKDDHELIDSLVGLLNRKFAADQQKILQRAQRTKLRALLIFSLDFDKQEELVKLSKQNSGFLYSLVGFHPNNLKRTLNDKQQQEKMQLLRDLCFNPVTVGVYCGLDLSREVSTHHQQLRFLDEHFKLAEELELPLVVFEVAGFDHLFEKLKQLATSKASASGWRKKAALVNFSGSKEELDAYFSLENPATETEEQSNPSNLDLYFMISGQITEPNEVGKRQQEILKSLPLNRLLLASMSPFFTPQNITDVWVRENRNEPSNLPSVLHFLSTLLLIERAVLAEQLVNNTKTFFSLKESEEKEDNSLKTTKKKKGSEEEEEEEEAEAEAEEEQGDHEIEAETEEAGEEEVAAEEEVVEEEEVQQSKISRKKAAKALKQKQFDEEEAEEDKPKSASEKKKGKQKQAAAEEQQDEAPAGKGKKGKKGKQNAEDDQQQEAKSEGGKKKSKKGKQNQEEEEDQQQEQEITTKKGKKKGKKVAFREEEEEQQMEAEVEEPEIIVKKANKKGKNVGFKEEEAEEQQTQEEVSTKKGKRKEKKEEQKKTKENESENQHPNEEKEGDEKEEEEAEEAEDEQQNKPKPSGTENIKYACKQCRKVLFFPQDIIDTSNHHQHMSSSVSVASDFSSSSSKREAGESLCTVFFIKHKDWMKISSSVLPAGAEEQTDQNNNTTGWEGKGEVEEGGKLECPGCSSKIGRWSLRTPLPCSCGTLLPPPAFMVKKKTMDTILPLSSLSQPRLDEEDELDDQDEDGDKKKKKNRRRKQKKSTSNFSNFRNKDYS